MRPLRHKQTLISFLFSLLKMCTLTHRTKWWRSRWHLRRPTSHEIKRRGKGGGRKSWEGRLGQSCEIYAGGCGRQCWRRRCAIPRVSLRIWRRRFGTCGRSIALAKGCLLRTGREHSFECPSLTRHQKGAETAIGVPRKYCLAL